MRLITLFVLLLSAKFAIAQSDLAAEIEKNKQCGDSYCTYAAGNDFEVTITGIGKPNAGIVFGRSKFEGDYYGSFGIMHGCVIVHNGASNPPILKELAFISPKNGKVYRNWKDCKFAS